MIDQLLGRPSATWKRTQVLFIIFFWIWRLRYSSPLGPRFLGIDRINRASWRFTPWQVIVGVCTLLYAGKNLDILLGLDSPEPLTRMYSRSFYRATWIVTGLDAGFATAVSIRPKWLKDICSVIFGIYYIIYHKKADEKLRLYRSVCSVEMLRATWEKTSNPYLRMMSCWDRPRISIYRRVVLPRPLDSAIKKPIIGWLFFNGSELELSRATGLILDFSGGGFVCMSPRNHEERLRRWAIRCERPVFSIDYRKAPEYPYPYAQFECFDAYRTIINSKGQCIGMSGSKLDIVLTGDSAGGNLAMTTMYRILQHPTPLPRPVAMVLSYAALDFSFTSWMSPEHLQIMRAEQSTSHLAGLAEQKDHFSHKSPLVVVSDVNKHKRRGKSHSVLEQHTRSIFRTKSNPFTDAMKREAEEAGNMADEEDVEEDQTGLRERDKPLSKRVVFSEMKYLVQQEEEDKVKTKVPIGTRLTMTSRTGYFQDRIISPTMMHALAILYMGPNYCPDFGRDYFVSPILAPPELLAELPRLLMVCGEKDPFVDDTVIFAGRVREAKKARKASLQAKGNPKRERLVAEREGDWVRVAIIEGWSHGFLQMSPIMREVIGAIHGIADWINEAYLKDGGRRRGQERVVAVSSSTETDECLSFVPKRRRESARISSSSMETVKVRAVEGPPLIESSGRLLARRQDDAVQNMAG